MPSKQRTSSKPSGKQKRELKKNRVVVREKGDDDDDAGGGEKEYADKKGSLILEAWCIGVVGEKDEAVGRFRRFDDDDEEV